MSQTSCSNLVYSNKGNAMLLSFIDTSTYPLILDCGCGAGDNAKYLKQKGSKVTGITISNAESIIAKEFCDEIYIADLEIGIPKEIDKKFNYVIMSHILEHLVNPTILLNDSKKFLEKNGKLIIALPNFLIYYNRIRILFGYFKYTDGGIMDQTHVRFYSPNLVKQLILDNGFEIEEIYNDGEIPLWIFRRFLSNNLKLKINKFLTSKFPSLFSYQTIVICKNIC